MHLLIRLVDLVAEDNAIEDAMYHLHRALNAGRLDLDRFIKVPSVFPSIHWNNSKLVSTLDYKRTCGGTVHETCLDREN